LKFGVFQDLEELDACFYDASLESIRKMKRITPHLKKIRVLSYPFSSEQINAMLDSLKHLESLYVLSKALNLPTDKVYQKLKFLHIENRYGQKFSLEDFVKMFPNLETLRFDYGPFEVTGSFLIELLIGLKQLKRLFLSTRVLKLDAEEALRCIRDYGGNLEEFGVNACVVIEPYTIFDEYKMAENPRQISIKKIL
jgi:hypothetical protein